MTKDLGSRQISPIDVMNRIEKIFVDTGDMKTPNNHFLVKTRSGLPPLTGLVNRQFKMIVKLNPINEGTVALYYDTWDFFRRPNRELNKAKVMEGYFTAGAVTRRMSSAQRLLMEPQHQRPNESVSQDSRDERLEQVISKSSESDSVIHDVSNAEKIIPPIIVSAMPVELIGKIDLRKCTPPHELCPYLKTNRIKMRSKLVP